MAEAAVDPASYDRLYQMLVDAHRDLSPDASRRLDARLILLLAERVGDPAAVRAALEEALAAEMAGGPPPDQRAGAVPEPGG